MVVSKKSSPKYELERIGMAKEAFRKLEKVLKNHTLARVLESMVW